MRLLFVSISLLLVCGLLADQHSFAQTGTLIKIAEKAAVDTSGPAKEEDVFTCYYPSYNFYLTPAGWADYLRENIQLDSIANDTIPVGTYKTIIGFSINSAGKIGDLEIVSDPGYGLAQKAIEVIANCKLRWTLDNEDAPGMKSYHRQPVTLIVPQEKERCDDLPSNEYLP